MTVPAHGRRDLGLLGLGAACHGGGMNGEQVIVGLLLFEMTGSSAWVGVGVALYFLPMLLVGPAAGALADRVDRRRVLVAAEIAETGVLLALAALAARGPSGPWPLLALTFASGTVRAVHHPARLGYVHDLEGASRLVSALGRLNVIVRAGQLVGSLLAGLVAGRYGAAVGFGALAGVHVVAAIGFALLRTPGRALEPSTGSPVESVLEYLAEIRRNATLRGLVVAVASVEILGYSYLTLLPEIASERLGLGAEGLGLLHALRGAGGLVAGLVLSRTTITRRLGALYLGVIIGFGLAVLALGLASGPTQIVSAVLLVAALASASDILSQSIMQLCVPDRLRGRAMGMWVLAVGTGPVGHLEIGVLAAALGAPLALMTNGVALIVAGALAVRALRDMET